MKKLFFGLMLLAGGVNFSPQQAEAAAAPQRCMIFEYNANCPEPVRILLRCIEGNCNDTCTYDSCLLN